MIEKFSKIKNIIKKFEDLSSIGIANIVGTAISTAFWLFLATIITTEEYGEISYFIAIGSIASIISLVGGNTTITVYTAKKIPIASTIFLISSLTSIVSALIVLLIVQNPTVSVYVIAYVIFVLTTSYFLGEKQFKKYSKIFILQKIIFVALALPLNFIIGPNGVVLGIALSFFIPTYAFIKILKEMKIDYLLIRSRVSFIGNSYGKDLSRVVAVQIDKIIIAPFFGFALLGNYYLGLQFLSVLTIIPTIMFQYTLTHDSIGSSTSGLKKGVIILSAIIAALGIVASPYVLPIFFPKFVHAIEILQILSIAIIPRTVSMMYSSEFLGTEESHTVLKGALIALGVQIPLIFILGTYFGVNGVALALVLAETTLMIYYIIMKKKTKARTV